MTEVKNIFTSNDLISRFLKNRGSKTYLKLFIYGPLRGGFFGFAFLFTIIIFVKLFIFLLAFNVELTFSVKDVILASFGLLFGILINLLYIVKKLYYYDER